MNEDAAKMAERLEAQLRANRVNSYMDGKDRFVVTDVAEALARITELEDALRVLLVENEGRYATKEAWDRARKVLGTTGGQHQ